MTTPNDPQTYKENVRADGRVELVCPHGVGHPIYCPTSTTDIHGCDGCCQRDGFLEAQARWFAAHPLPGPTESHD